MKERSSAWYRKKCVELAKVKAKERDGYVCQYCGRSKSAGFMIHGSHVLPEGAYPLMSDEPFNIISLCAEHHLGGSNPRMNKTIESWHSHPLLFSNWFNNKWPGRYQELKDMAEEKKMHVVNWKKRYEFYRTSARQGN